MNNSVGPGSGLVSESPAVDFPVYGLAAAWSGSRWLELFGDAIGAPVLYVSLGHQSLDDETVTLVQTYSRPRTDARAAAFGESPPRYLASAAAVMLVNVSLPAQSVTRPAGLNQALADYAASFGRQFGQWPAVRWRVAGIEVPAHVWRFAGWWAGVSAAVDDVYLAAVGCGREPEGLSLAVVENGSLYHVDLAEPLRYARVIAASKAARVGGDRPLPRRQDWHPDQLRTISGR